MSKNLYFLKVSKLPKTQMDLFNDRVINAPIEDDDLLKTSRSLPRSRDNGLVPIYMSTMSWKTTLGENLDVTFSNHIFVVRE